MAYASVGLGGGSAYTALLVIFSFNQQTIPLVSLMLNLVVSSLAAYHFARQGYLRAHILLPFLLTSIPAAWLGGAMDLSPRLFQWLLLLSLLGVAFRVYATPGMAFQWQLAATPRVLISLLLGALLGWLAGVVGIGGGIYLVPFIIILGLGNVKQAAACGAVFVCLNSLSGLISRLHHHEVDWLTYLPLVAAVTLGGLFGARWGAGRWSAQRLEKILGAIIVLAIGLLGRKLLF